MGMARKPGDLPPILLQALEERGSRMQPVTVRRTFALCASLLTLAAFPATASATSSQQKSTPRSIMRSSTSSPSRKPNRRHSRLRRRLDSHLTGCRRHRHGCGQQLRRTCFQDYLLGKTTRNSGRGTAAPRHRLRASDPRPTPPGSTQPVFPPTQTSWHSWPGAGTPVPAASANRAASARRSGSWR